MLIVWLKNGCEQSSSQVEYVMHVFFWPTYLHFSRSRESHYRHSPNYNKLNRVIPTLWVLALHEILRYDQ